MQTVLKMERKEIKGDKGDKGDTGDTGPAGPTSGTLTGVSDWGSNLIAAPTRRTAVGLLIPVDMSGDVDEVYIEMASSPTRSGAIGTVTDRVSRSFPVNTANPLSSTPNSYTVGQQGGGGGGGSHLVIGSKFSFTGSGASTNLRWDSVSTGTGNPVVTGVYKKTRLSGSAPSSGGLNQAAVDERVKAGVQDFAEANNTALVPDNKLPRMSSRIGFSVSGVNANGVNSLVTQGARTRDTATSATTSTGIMYHKLSFTKFGDETWANTDLNNGNITFVGNDFRNVVVRLDFGVAQTVTPTSGNDRLEIGLAIVQLMSNGTRVVRKRALGQYMRNNRVDPPFRSINVEIERSFTLPDPHVNETWEFYLVTESQVAGRSLRINSYWEHTNAESGSVQGAQGGGLLLLGHRY